MLGIDPSDPKNAHGKNWAQLGLYENADLSRKIREELAYSTQPQIGVYLAPIESFDKVPDIVQVAVNPFNCMRIVQGYAYHYGMPKAVNMIGNQAICLECTARPYVLKDMNISVLCIGTRHRSGWKDHEMAAGIPGEQFEKVTDGLLQTINAMESDKNKAAIERKLAEAGIPYNIRYHYNYYTEC